MTAFLVNLGQYIEEKRLHIKVECFVVQEQFGQQAQILTVYLMIATIDLKHRDSSLAINLLPGRLVQRTLPHMLDIRPLELHVLEAVLADPELGLFAVLLRVRGEVPSVDLVLSDLDLVDVFDFGEGFMLLLECSCGWVHFIVGLCTKIGVVMYPTQHMNSVFLTTVRSSTTIKHLLCTQEGTFKKDMHPSYTHHAIKHQNTMCK